MKTRQGACTYDVCIGKGEKGTQKADEKTDKLCKYREWLKGMQILLSGTQAGPGRTGKQEQEQISRNHVQTF